MPCMWAARSRKDIAFWLLCRHNILARAVILQIGLGPAQDRLHIPSEKNAQLDSRSLHLFRVQEHWFTIGRVRHRLGVDLLRALQT